MAYPTLGEGGHRILMLDLFLAKSIYRNRRELRVPEYRRGIKDPNITQWQCGPVSHATILVKVFQRLDSTLSKELERGFLQAVGSDTNL